VRRCLLAIGVITALLIVACAPRPVLPRHPGGATIRIKVKEGTLESVRDLPLEDYVAGAALSEAAPGAAGGGDVRSSGDRRADHAEAHRGRHAREGFDLARPPIARSTSHASPIAVAPVLDAVQRTAGVILMYDGAPADAVPRRLRRVDERRRRRVSGPPRTYLPARPDRAT
jgi:hypothetical protein